MLSNLSNGEFTPREEIERRIGQLRARMAKKNVGFAVILQNVDMFYFTGTIQKGVLVIPVDDEPVLMVERSIERALAETPLPVTPIGGDREVKDILKDRNVLRGTGGMELDVVPVTVYERWKKILGFERFTDISTEIKDVRIVKSEFELAQVKRSGEVVSRVFEKARELVEEGVREVDIAAVLEGEGRRWGHQGFLRMRGLNQEMMNVYITHGRSATIHSSGDVPISGVGVTHAIAQGPSLNRVERGVPVIIDYGGGYNGYITDETRMFVVGELKEPFRKAYEVAKEIIEETMAFAKEGVTGPEVFNLALNIAKREGLEDHFMGHGPGKVSFIGHGLGLEINELPVITPRHGIVLKEGMVFAFEPKFIFPGLGAAGIEVDFIVRKDRLERVTDTPVDVVLL
jgi:Xaa-Pro dipeptidase